MQIQFLTVLQRMHVQAEQLKFLSIRIDFSCQFYFVAVHNYLRRKKKDTEKYCNKKIALDKILTHFCNLKLHS